MIKDILLYTGIFIALLAIMTFILYSQKKSEIEELIAERTRIADSTAVADSIAKADSVKMVQDSLYGTPESDIVPTSETDETLTAEDQTQIEPEESEEIKEYKSVAKIYEKMKPAQAAQVLNGLTDDEKAHILAVMKDRQAAKILSQMDPAAAGRISRIIMSMKKE